MASVLRFRSVWGIETGNNYENWDKWYPTLKAQGYCMSPFSFLSRFPQLTLSFYCLAGVEVDFSGLSDLLTIRQLANKHGLEISVL